MAHELGHVELGDDRDNNDEVVDIDPARVSEPSPVGIDRVVDYGRKQRREVQMDLFAREFLLPRAVARRLHLEDELTASAIAERLGAPFEVVAQQLLDALLLPVIIESRPSEKRESSPNELQRLAAAHRGQAYLLRGGARTGRPTLWRFALKAYLLTASTRRGLFLNVLEQGGGRNPNESAANTRAPQPRCGSEHFTLLVSM